MSEADRISDAVLFEGYLLYPYRSSALKNLRRYPLGTLYPEPFCSAFDAGDAASLQLECIAVGPPEAELQVRLRFLQLGPEVPVVREVRLERRTLGELSSGASVPFTFAPLLGELSASAREARPEVFVVTVRAVNRSTHEAADRDRALEHSLASPHLIASLFGGELVSMIDPPEPVRELALSCRSVQTWPVLVGDELLSAPIILPDQPAIAPESPGDFFDGTEIDELLTLRLLTLTPEEKEAISDPRARAILERTEALGTAALEKLHGRRVILRPKGRADIFDLALAGKSATIESIERDLEGRTYVAVTVDEDPGKDLGAFGHRFFFSPEEVEPT